MIWSKLGITGGCGECGFGDELVGLVIEAVANIAAKETIYERCLNIIVMMKRCGTLGSKEESKRYMRNVALEYKGKLTVRHQRVLPRNHRTFQLQTILWLRGDPCSGDSMLASFPQSHVQGPMPCCMCLVRCADSVK